ncbi:hypothetical protein TEA_005849 [Camellia sinensis var. sinensis]|uniref:Uncharacterized protein n=1 Tax=Camellia sinensis var. sinensis TaxID=542762 RepID=A0A4S4EKA8_CAMSN|nr:hypothetical protein TEA_005849 [Camellia sinensis var. sinensis]
MIVRDDGARGLAVTIRISIDYSNLVISYVTANSAVKKPSPALSPLFSLPLYNDDAPLNRRREKISLSSDFEDEFSWKMKINGSDCVETVKSPPSHEEFGGDDKDFYFACIAPDESPSSIDDVFQNG